MRQRLWFAAVLAALSSGCGGSSSETPPPLQPDPYGFRYASTAPFRVDEPSSGGAPGLDLDEPAKSSAPSPLPPSSPRTP